MIPTTVPQRITLSLRRPPLVALTKFKMSESRPRSMLPYPRTILGVPQTSSPANLPETATLRNCQCVFHLNKDKRLGPKAAT